MQNEVVINASRMGAKYVTGGELKITHSNSCEFFCCHIEILYYLHQTQNMKRMIIKTNINRLPSSASEIIVDDSGSPVRQACNK